MKNCDIINFKNHMAMKKYLITLVFVAGATALFTACTSESGGPSTSISYEQVKAAEQVPVTFGTYMGEQAITRYGAVGSIDNNAGLQAKGFGVFAYYTNNGDYVASGGSASLPNFMYNQSVTYSASAWSYTPIKYWPNEYGDTAESTGTDKLTFFAYAPYTTVTASTGLPNGTEGVAGSGITALTRNSSGGDPKVSYTVAVDPANSVDLLYGVVGTATKDGPFGASGNTVALGGQYLNITKQAVSGEINYDFKHALARLNFTIQGAFDDDTMPTTDDVDGNTKITVKSVELLGTNFYSDGVLNLNGGVWDVSEASTTSTSMTIEDPYLNSDIVDLGANDDTVQAESSEGADDGLFGANSTVTGINNTEMDLATSEYYMIIPSSTTITGVRITYFVNTQDANLNAGYSRVKNVISKNFVSAISVNQGKSYNFKLNVGMTTVKVNASVSNWTDDDHEVWLPINTD